MKPEEYQDSVRSLRDFYAGVSDSTPERLRALAGSLPLEETAYAPADVLRVPLAGNPTRETAIGQTVAENNPDYNPATAHLPSPEDLRKWHAGGREAEQAEQAKLARRRARWDAAKALQNELTTKPTT